MPVQIARQTVTHEIQGMINPLLYQFADDFTLSRIKNRIQHLMTVNPGIGYTLKAVYDLFVGDTDQSVKDSENAICNDPSNPVHYFYYGSVLMWLERYEEGFFQYEKAIELDPVNLIYLERVLNVAFIVNDMRRFHLFSGQYKRLSPTADASHFVAALVSNIGNRIKFITRGIGPVFFKEPIVVWMENDEGQYLATSETFPSYLYGTGDTSQEAFEMFMAVVNEVYADLQEDDGFSEEFLLLKQQFSEIVEGVSA